jgi:hypothetical protein
MAGIAGLENGEEYGNLTASTNPIGGIRDSTTETDLKRVPIHAIPAKQAKPV